MADFAAVAREFERLVGGAEGGGALVVRLGGEAVSTCTGTADRLGRGPWTRDTLGLSFSTTKGVASTVIHRLADRGVLAYDEPVATYWPAFAAGGKGRITVRHVLTHRAGLQIVRRGRERAEDLLDHLAMEARLAARPVLRPDRALGLPRDHVRLATLRARAPHHRPRNDRADPRGDRRAARTRRTAHRRAPRRRRQGRGAGRVRAAPRPAAAQLLAPRLAAHRAHPHGRRRPARPGLPPPVRGLEAADLGGADARRQRRVHAPTRSRGMYGALARRGGGPLLSPGRPTRSAACRCARPTACSGCRCAGASATTRRSAPAAGPPAFGHYGYGGSGGWADPEIGVSLGFVTNRIGSVSTPLGDFKLFRLTGLVRQAAAQSAPASRAAGRAA